MSSLNEILKSSAKLSPQKQTALNLLCTNNYMSSHYTAFFKSFDISGPQYNVLRILRGQKGVPANLSTIQERMIHKNSNTSRLIDKLIQKKYVKRTQCESNRRKIELLITGEGLSLLNDIDPKIDTLEKKLISVLTDKEIITLNQILEKLRT